MSELTDAHLGRVVKTTAIYTVAVWWPRDGGYGGAHTLATLDDAREKVMSLRRSGYEHVDVWKTEITPC